MRGMPGGMEQRATDGGSFFHSGEDSAMESLPEPRCRCHDGRAHRLEIIPKMPQRSVESVEAAGHGEHLNDPLVDMPYWKDRESAVGWAKGKWEILHLRHDGGMR